MRILLGDSVIIGNDKRSVGIVERRSGNQLVIRRPDAGNQREHVARNEVSPLAELMYIARKNETRFRNGLSLVGDSNLAELVEAFGYSVGQMRQDSLGRVKRQLERAGLRIETRSGDWNRDDRFILTLGTPVDEGRKTKLGEPTTSSAALTTVALPETFWPTALGLHDGRELAFLRALTGREPLLCLLRLPAGASPQGWLQPTWEGLTAWAFRSAQRFIRTPSGESGTPDVRIGPAAMLHGFLKPSVIGSDGPTLAIQPHSLNLITLKQDTDSPVDFPRLKVTWPGPIFEFDGAEAREGGRELLELLMLVGGSPPEDSGSRPESLSPLKMLLWCREACSQIAARVDAGIGHVLSSEQLSSLKGSSERSSALGLKLHLAQWLKRRDPKLALRFEERKVEDRGEDSRTTRVDLAIEGQDFEVETMAGSGPMEDFYHRKVFSRLRRNTKFSLVVPGEALLWAGPYLSDIAHHLGERGQVLFPGADDGFLALKPQELDARAIEVEDPLEAALIDPSLQRTGQQAEAALTLKEVAGYEHIVEHVRQSIIWPEKYPRFMRGLSRAAGILLFGPPGCGKSRLARAIAGELGQEVRLLGPADLRGPYIGWGQVMIREQFDWVSERERRMLIIDELDAVARSRREPGGMHNDEKADVNELLVQLDRATRLGRLVVGTTNYVDSLDDAIIRSGRFGRFIPIPPPDVDEALAILLYYLETLTKHEEGMERPNVHVPSKAELRPLVESLHSENVRNRRFFCGADLEAAVNETYLRCLRRMFPDEESIAAARTMTLVINHQELATSLESGPRSVVEDAFDGFLRDVERFCGPGLLRQLLARFGQQ